MYFVMDAVKKTILAYPVSATRDTEASIRALDSALSKFSEIPDDLNLVFDGNPTYLLAQHFFAQHDIYFDMKQVIGLKNEDSVSFVTLFVAYFNFLRPHSSLEKRVPALVPELADLPNMPAKWQKLLALSEECILKHQAIS